MSIDQLFGKGSLRWGIRQEGMIWVVDGRVLAKAIRPNGCSGAKFEMFRAAMFAG